MNIKTTPDKSPVYGRITAQVVKFQTVTGERLQARVPTCEIARAMKIVLDQYMGAQIVSVTPEIE